MKAGFDALERNSSERRVPEGLLHGAGERMGVDFSGVRLYENDTLGETGNAFTKGNRVYMPRGSLGTPEGEKILRHELTHVAQQGAGLAKGSGLLDSPALESSADRGEISPQAAANYSSPSAEGAPVQALDPLSIAAIALTAGATAAAVGGIVYGGPTAAYKLQRMLGKKDKFRANPRDLNEEKFDGSENSMVREIMGNRSRLMNEQRKKTARTTDNSKFITDFGKNQESFGKESLSSKLGYFWNAIRSENRIEGGNRAEVRNRSFMRELKKKRWKGMNFKEKLADYILPDEYDAEDANKKANLNDDFAKRAKEDGKDPIKLYKDKQLKHAVNKDDLLLPSQRKGITMGGIAKKAIDPKNWGGMAMKGAKGAVSGAKSLITTPSSLTFGVGMYLRDSAMLSDYKKDMNKRNKARQDYKEKNAISKQGPEKIREYLKNTLASNSKRNDAANEEFGTMFPDQVGKVSSENSIDSRIIGAYGSGMGSGDRKTFFSDYGGPDKSKRKGHLDNIFGDYSSKVKGLNEGMMDENYMVDNFKDLWRFTELQNGYSNLMKENPDYKLSGEQQELLGAGGDASTAMAGRLAALLGKYGLDQKGGDIDKLSGSSLKDMEDFTKGQYMTGLEGIKGIKAKYSEPKGDSKGNSKLHSGLNAIKNIGAMGYTGAKSGIGALGSGLKAGAGKLGGLGGKMGTQWTKLRHIFD
jgi:hypothetical protein